jgi:hypothetical protein
MKKKVQTTSHNQIKFDWALNLCQRDKQKMNLTNLNEREREILFQNEQRKLRKKLFNSTKEIVEYLKYNSNIVTFYIPRLDMLEITYFVKDENTMILKATDTKTEIHCLFKVEKTTDKKYKLEFLKIDYSLIKLVEKCYKTA